MFRSLNQNSQAQSQNPHNLAVPTRKLPQTSKMAELAGRNYENRAFQPGFLALLPGLSGICT